MCDNKEFDIADEIMEEEVAASEETEADAEDEIKILKNWQKPCY